MELQSVTAKVDALREKGFSDTEINQLLGTTPQGEGAAPLSEASVLDALKQGNTQILQQFSKGKDPEIFNAKVDEIVGFLEKDTKKLFKRVLSTFAAIFVVFASYGVVFINTPTLPINAFWLAFIAIFMLFVLMFMTIYRSLKNRYEFLKPRLLYFIRR